MAGTFILSLDCEGKWGMADSLTPAHDMWLTSSNLRDAYRRLLDLFAEHRVAATFAFVMAFLLSPEEQREHDDLFQDHEINGINWLVNFRRAQAAGNLDGWSSPELLGMVQAHPEHEVGCHGYSHLPLDEQLVSRPVARHELAAATAIARLRGVSLKTFIYPRNLVGYPDELGREDFIGYRARLTSRAGMAGRAANLLTEFNPFTPPQTQVPGAIGSLVPIPSGHFFNWRTGPRRYVPKALTLERWKRMLDQAAASAGVVHLWLHPHNVISGPGTFDVLAGVLRHVAQLRDRGLITIHTQQRYCAALTPSV
jgi:peptidoglycan/xylan/chitin deacetylase (PgdA/CDA1 family)